MLGLMRTCTLVIALAALSLLGGKCKGPKPPRAEAIDAVEEAYWVANVPEELGAAPGATLAVEVDVAVEDEAHEAPPDVAVVRFTRLEGEVLGTVAIGAETFAYVMSAGGEAHPTSR